MHTCKNTQVFLVFTTIYSNTGIHQTFSKYKAIYWLYNTIFKLLRLAQGTLLCYGNRFVARVGENTVGQNNIILDANDL